MIDLYITTSGRSNRQLTYDRLDPRLQAQVKFVVQGREFDEYKKGLKLPRERFVVLPPAIQRLTPTRDYMYNYVVKRFQQRAGARAVCFLDDDLYFYRRKSVKDWHLRYTEPAETVEMFDLLAAWLAGGCGHAGISAREGNNRINTAYVENTRYMRVLAFDCAALAKVKLNLDMHTMSDFDTNLQLLRAGFKSRVSFFYSQGQGHILAQEGRGGGAGSNAPGGCSVYRTLDMQADSARKLAEHHAPFVKLVEKETKGAWGGGARTDVICYWKKAYESSGRDA